MVTLAMTGCAARTGGGALAAPRSGTTTSRYLGDDVTLRDGPVPARFGAPLPSTADEARGLRIGQDENLPPHGYVEGLIARLDPDILERFRDAVRQAPPDERDQVVDVYSGWIDGAVENNEANCRQVRPLMVRGDALTELLAPYYGKCAAATEQAWFESLGLPDRLTSSFYEAWGLAPPYRAESATRLAAVLTPTTADVDTLNDFYTGIERLVSSGDPRAIDLLLAQSTMFEAAVRKALFDSASTPSDLDDRLRQIFVDIVDAIPMGTGADRLRARCAGKADAGLTPCHADVLAHVSESAPDPSVVAERMAMRQRMAEYRRDEASEDDDEYDEDVTCAGPPGGHDACWPRPDLQARLRALGLLDGTAPAPTKIAPQPVTAFALLTKAKRADSFMLGLLDGAEGVFPQLIALAGPDAVGLTMITARSQVEDVDTGGSRGLVVIHGFLGGKRGELAVDATTRAELEGAIAVINAALRDRGSPWRLLTVESSPAEVRVVAGPRAALDAAVDADLLRPDRGPYRR